MRYPVIIHKDEHSHYGVTVPDLPGCFSAGETLEGAIHQAEEAIMTHIEGLMLDKEPVPMPSPIDLLQKTWAGDDGFWALVMINLAKLSDKTKRINITIPENILSKVDACAALVGQSRSSLLVTAALEYMAKH